MKDQLQNVTAILCMTLIAFLYLNVLCHVSISQGERENVRELCSIACAFLAAIDDLELMNKLYESVSSCWLSVISREEVVSCGMGRVLRGRKRYSDEWAIFKMVWEKNKSVGEFSVDFPCPVTHSMQQRYVCYKKTVWRGSDVFVVGQISKNSTTMRTLI